MPKRYLLLDRDGTLIVEQDNLHDPDGVVIIPGAVEALRRYVDAGWGLAVVTNQSGVARKIFTLEQMHSVNERVQTLLEEQGIKIEKFYACVHAPEISECTCRKPKPGLVQQAVSDLGLEPNASMMVGDKGSDIGLGKNVGAVTVLVRTGYGQKEQHRSDLDPDYIVDSVADLCPTMADSRI